MIIGDACVYPLSDSMGQRQEKNDIRRRSQRGKTGIVLYQGKGSRRRISVDTAGKQENAAARSGRDKADGCDAHRGGQRQRAARPPGARAPRPKRCTTPFAAVVGPRRRRSDDGGVGGPAPAPQGESAPVSKGGPVAPELATTTPLPTVTPVTGACGKATRTAACRAVGAPGPVAAPPFPSGAPRRRADTDTASHVRQTDRHGHNEGQPEDKWPALPESVGAAFPAPHAHLHKPMHTPRQGNKNDGRHGGG